MTKTMTTPEAMIADIAKASGLPAAQITPLISAVYLGAKNEGFDVEPAVLTALSADLVTFLSNRSGGEIKIAVNAAAGQEDFGVIFLNMDDRPFLVASVTAELTAQQIETIALIHPVLAMPRSPDGVWQSKGGSSRDESIMMIVTASLSPRAAQALEKGLRGTLEDVAIVVSDFDAMRGALDAARAELARAAASPKLGKSAADIAEGCAFLDWLHSGNFVLMGVRYFDFQNLVKDKAGNFEPRVDTSRNLGLLRDPALRILRDASEPTQVSAKGEVVNAGDEAVIIAKSNLVSRVHRRVRHDYISVKSYDGSGKIIAETRFIGLFTAAAYNLPPSDVPLLRRKLDYVREKSGMAPGSHAAKTLDYVLSTYPRDELFQSEGDDLARIATGIVSVLDRPRARLFVRRDPYNRFVSALVFVPREQYNSMLRRRIGEALKTAYDGRVSAFYPRYSDDPVARVHFIIGLSATSNLTPDLEALEREIHTLSLSWSARLISRAEQSGDESLAEKIMPFAGGFGAAYKDAFGPDEALIDLREAVNLGLVPGPMRIRAYRMAGDGDDILRAKVYRAGERLELSNVMPVFANMGLHIAQETGYKLSATGRAPVWIHDYEMRLPRTGAGAGADLDGLAKNFQDAFIAVLSGQNDDDAFNRLVLAQNMPWRKIAFLRAMCRYRQQSGMDPSEAVQIEALTLYPEIAKGLLDAIALRFDPEQFADMDARRAACGAHFDSLLGLLGGVKSLDHDRALRRLIELFAQILRTNFYQLDDEAKSPGAISFKVASNQLEALPAPKPYREIFVWAPHIEGVHLRFGPVARGGLRWSDRREDYRTEVLGLVKAQQVKNAVIVPVGSKGGFYPKSLPVNGDRDAVMAAGISAYKTFIGGLLDITDNYQGKDTVSAPRTICWDAPDPYLVVAADKGTASFSDIANGLAIARGFWLGDAFASGGSVGYDHKKMGITARGGWEAVKRHFREMGKDIQSEDFDVIGVGDMSGDVFGNGMLLSRHIRLRAAFNHLHIFIDPNPDPKASFSERERLFALPRSNWSDYNASLISKGGGVFARSEKSIPLTDEIKAMTGLTVAAVTPAELIHALLKSETELMWFGGIGTYIKASHQSHAQVGDKANDLIRVDGKILRAKVIGEGANLGATQAGRIEFARHGGRLNTDAIDNSAGVDSSDNEVNIKILLRGAIESGALKEADRNALLASMTDDVAALVLAHNYDQTCALSLAESGAASDHSAYERLMKTLEGEGRLDRAVEGLPGSLDMRELAQSGGALTRPEIAVLIAYAKIKLFDDLIGSDLARDPSLHFVLEDYFPKALNDFDDAMAGHRLRDEIICSRLANLVVDVGGPVFMQRLTEQTHASAAYIVRAFMVGYSALDAARLRREIGALDNKVPAQSQYDLLGELAQTLARVTGWMVRRGENGPIAPRLEKRETALKALDKDWLELLSPYDRKRAQTRISRFIKDGIPEALAEDVSLLRTRASGFDVIDFAAKTGWPLHDAAGLYYDMSGRFKIDRMRNAGLGANLSDHWDRLALKRILEDFYAVQGQLAGLAAAHHKSEGGKSSDPSKAIIEGWIKAAVPTIDSYDAAYARLSAEGNWSLAMFTLALAQLQELALLSGQ